ncbi:MAG: D-alanine--D-alanine ligase, partial [Bacteroidota bacterium]
MKIGIFFGGPSREREIAFAGGRTVYDNLDKTLFEPVPIFVDSQGQMILLNWPYIYKGTIRDFYPPVNFLPESIHQFQIYIESIQGLDSSTRQAIYNDVGKPISTSELPGLIDFGFLSIHGTFGEDGQIQGLLESLDIPYTGSGIRPSSIGMDKAFQKKIMEAGGFDCPPVQIIDRRAWLGFTEADQKAAFNKAVEQIQWPIVIRPANQGSSIGVTILPERAGFEGFVQSIDKAFFRTTLQASDWYNWSTEERVQFLRSTADIREGVGFPLRWGVKDYWHPEVLFADLNQHFEQSAAPVLLEGHLSESRILLEGFISGKEFSCIVIKKEDDSIVALPPTEIVKGGELFDYRSKYLAGLSRKETPIRLATKKIQAIRRACERLFEYLEFHTYARIDGFITADDRIFLNDPNTTSGMLPSSFFFHQAAEIGLNPSQFLTYIIRQSLQERAAGERRFGKTEGLILELDDQLEALKSQTVQKKRIAVILGGYSSERHISVESGRNIYEKLASSNKYEPFPVFLTGDSAHFRLFQIPINLLLKDNADDIRDRIFDYKQHEVVEGIKTQCQDLTDKYAFTTTVFEPIELDMAALKARADGVFIALHGRPGEDGTIQKSLEAAGIPYNGSPPESSEITINKYETLQLLRANGFKVTQQRLVDIQEFAANPKALLDDLESNFDYPLIAKPVDDGCSSAVKKINKREQLHTFFEGMFREEERLSDLLRQRLDLLPKEEFPRKRQVLIETLISPEGAEKFMEITGGMLTHHENGRVRFEVFEPSETLAGGEVLTLEEKFLAGEGQNITPARFSDDPQEYVRIAQIVKNDLKRAAQILKVRGYSRIDAFVRIFGDGRVETI